LSGPAAQAPNARATRAPTCSAAHNPGIHDPDTDTAPMLVLLEHLQYMYSQSWYP